MILYVGNSNVVELVGLKNSVTGDADEGATVNVTIQDEEGSNVTGQSWPLALSHTEGGTYIGTLDSTLAIEESKCYVAIVTATGSGNETGRWECIVSAATRRCS